MTFSIQLHTLVCMESSKSLKSIELAAVKQIRNWIAHKGRWPSIRELMTALGYKSPRSVQDVLESLVTKKIIKKVGRSYQLLRNPDLDSNHAQTVNIPIVGAITAGTPIFAEENLEGFVPVSTTLAKPGSRYFLLHVQGDSMNETGIEDGDLVLIRQQPVADNGQKVVALIDNDATIKELHKEKDVVILKPRSTNKDHKPIILSRDFQIQGIVVATIPNFWEKNYEN